MRYQHSVGHGGFHATIVQTGHTISGTRPDYLVYIYDIGAKPSIRKLEGAVTKFLNRLIKLKIERIDYLFLSHIDDDHVNGVAYFLDKCESLGIEIDAVVLPWLSPLSSLLARSRVQSNFALTVLSDPQNIRDFTSATIGEIIVIVPSADPRVSDDDDEDSPTDDSSASDEDRPVANSSSNPQVAGPVNSKANTTNAITQWPSGRQFTHNVPIGWILLPFQAKPDSSVLLSFEKELQRLTKLDPKDPKNHVEIVQKHRKCIRKAMKFAAKHSVGSRPIVGLRGTLTNWSTMSLLAGVANSPPHKHRLALDKTVVIKDDCLWLHTGDAPLDQRTYYSEFNQTYSAHQGQICVTLAPHHGSVLGHLDQYYLDYSPDHILIACGVTTKNRKSHNLPVPLVIASASQKGRKRVALLRN